MIEFFARWSRDRFARRVMQSKSRAGGPGDWVYDRETFFLRRSEVVANLGNVYQAYQQATGAQRQLLFDNFIAAYVQQEEIPSSFLEVESKLIAVVRERAFLAAL